MVRTLASHAGNRGSSPRGTTNKENKGFGIVAGPFFYARQIHFQPYFQPADQKEPPVTEIDGIVAMRNVQVLELDLVDLDQDVDVLRGIICEQYEMLTMVSDVFHGRRSHIAGRC